MNARQKAKYYKRKYQELLNNPIIPKLIPCRIDTLSFEHNYAKEFVVGKNAQYLKEITISDIGHVLARNVIDNFDRYVDYRTWFNPVSNEYKIVARVFICRKES